MGIGAFHKALVVRPLNENQSVCSTCQTQLKFFKRKKNCFKCESLNCASCMFYLPNKRYYCSNCYDNEQVQNRNLAYNVRMDNDLSIESIETSSENLEESETITVRKTKQNKKKSIYCHRNQSLSENKTSETNQMAINYKASNHLLTVSDIECLSKISELTVRQLKLILTRNYVDFRGCCEKKDLEEKVRLLWQQKQLNEGPDDLNDDTLCKICMEEPIDCVLLECGHMATCTRCGKKLNECPLCRQYIIRIVHTFRA